MIVTALSWQNPPVQPFRRMLVKLRGWTAEDVPFINIAASYKVSKGRQINISFTHKIMLYPVKFYLHVIYDNLYCHFLLKTWIVSFPYSVKSFSIETSCLNLIKNRTSKSVRKAVYLSTEIVFIICYPCSNNRFHDRYTPQRRKNGQKKRGLEVERTDMKRGEGEGCKF
jgi:hypothetical protein